MMAVAGVRGELDCTICLCIYNNPVTLSCGHTFCHDCIDKIWQGKHKGDYECPECRKKFDARPELNKNIALSNIVASICSSSCSQEKPLNWKCTIHNKTMEFYCFNDSACVCVSCFVIGEHKGHQVEPLAEASEKMKKEIKDVLEKLTLKDQQVEKRVINLEAYKTKVEKQADNVKERIDSMFHKIKAQLDHLQKQFKDEMTHQEGQRTQPVLEQIQKRVELRDDMSKRIKRIEGLENVTAPLQFLLECSTCKKDIGDDQDPPLLGDLDEVQIIMTLQSRIPGFLAAIKAQKLFYLQPITDIVLDTNTSGTYVSISPDLKTATALGHIRQPDSPHRFQYSQVLSTAKFCSGRHYWEVATSLTGRWRVGIAYNSIDRRGDGHLLGNNSKSWCMDMCNNVHLMIHNHQVTHVGLSTPNPKLGIYLDYEAGRLSFFELDQQAKHVHTFTTKFTEPVYAAFGVYVSQASVTILSAYN
ncbi:E3 ubiquitin-protein ligase TRIM39-like [Lithobates pipiens]